MEEIKTITLKVSGGSNPAVCQDLTTTCLSEAAGRDADADADGDGLHPD